MPASKLVPLIGIHTPEAMEALGAQLAARAWPGIRVHLVGPLAAGKTTLARGYVRARGHRGAVKSPTYTIVETYELPAATVHHFDLYRLVRAEELDFIGIEDYFDGVAEVLVEWPERGADIIASADIEVSIEVAGIYREVRLSAHGAAGIEAISKIGTLY